MSVNVFRVSYRDVNKRLRAAMKEGAGKSSSIQFAKHYGGKLLHDGVVESVGKAGFTFVSAGKYRVFVSYVELFCGYVQFTDKALAGRVRKAIEGLKFGKMELPSSIENWREAASL